ncbi:MAG: DUF285 domain-containing protein [Bacteroidales bacterium]|nr:DUF285 domain-containing protein [Bacteroidales bacterium]
MKNLFTRMGSVFRDRLAAPLLLILASLLLSQTTFAQTPYCTFNESTGTLTLAYGEMPDGAAEANVNIEDWTYIGSNTTSPENVQKVVFDQSFADFYPTSYACWFLGCSNLKEIEGLQYLNTENVTNMTWMFYGCSSLTSLDLNSFKTENVTDMGGMFSGCSSLTSLDLSSFNTENVTSMGFMFYGCSSLTSLDLSSFNTGNVTNMYRMFYGCSSLTSLDLSSFNTENVTYMTDMFYGCSNLTSLDLSSFNTGNVTDMTDMFYGCSSLKTIYVGDNWSTGNIQSGYEIFRDCTSLFGGKGTAYNPEITDQTYARIDGGADAPGYFTRVGEPAYVPTVAYCTFDESTGTLTLGYGKEIPDGAAEANVNTGWSYIGSKITRAENVQKVVFDQSFADFYPTSCAWWFFVCSNLKEIEGLQYLNTENVTDMDWMFDVCSSLTNLDLSSFNTGNVMNMGGMFSDCSSLTSLDLSSFNTENITNINSIFSGCSSLTSLDLSSFNTENVTNMHRMFEGCSSLTSLDLSSFNTGNVTDMSSMFYGCSSLTSLDLSSFNTGNVTSMDYMFYGCSSLQTIFVDNNWSMDNTMSSENMFFGCENLYGEKGTECTAEHVDFEYARIDEGNSLPGYFTAKNSNPYKPKPLEGVQPYAVFQNGVLTFAYDDKHNGKGYPMPKMLPEWSAIAKDIQTVVFDQSFADYKPTSVLRWFYDCINLNKIEGIEYLNTENITNMGYMFYGCSSLTNLDLSKLNTENVTDMGGMFSGCSSLTSLDLSSFNTGNVTNTNNMFIGCSSLTNLDLSNFNTGNVTNMGYMFYGCSSLKTIYVGDNWSTGNIQSGYEIFHNCTSLIGGKGTAYNPEITDQTYARIDGGADAPGYFTRVGEPAYVPPVAYCTFDESTGTLTLAYGEMPDGAAETNVNAGWSYIGSNITSAENVQKVVFDESFADFYPTSCACWFLVCSNLKEIEGLQYLNTENVTDMNSMFLGCSSLTSLDLSSFNTENVTNMSSLFAGCSSLTSLDLSSFNTGNVTNMGGMFYGCSSLTSLDLSSFNTGNVTNMGLMFSGCSSLPSLDLSGFKTENVTNMGDMFYGCTSLQTIFVDNNWSMDKTWFSENMFFGCENLYGEKGTECTAEHVGKEYARIDEGNSLPGYFTAKNSNPYKPQKTLEGTQPYAVFQNGVLKFAYDDKHNGKGYPMPKMLPEWSAIAKDIQTVVFDQSFADYKPTSVYCWFNGCSNLSEIEGLQYLNTENITNINNMFFGCSSLTSLDLSSFNTGNVTDMGGMFSGCSSLTSLDLSSFNTGNVTNTNNMFSDCNSLTNLDLSNFNTGNVTNMGYMFYGCSSLKTIYVGDNWSTGNIQFGYEIFRDCTSLIGGKGTAYNPDITDQTYARIDGGADAPGYFSVKEKNPYKKPELKDDFYQISNAEELLWFMFDVNSGNTDANAQLTADIILNEDLLKKIADMMKPTSKSISKDEPANLAEWQPIGTKENPFSGIFDGNGHTISGLYINDNTKENVGLFGVAAPDAVIKNLGVTQSYIAGKENVGAICGKTEGIVVNCYTTATVKGTENVSNIAGKVEEPGKVVNSYYLAEKADADDPQAKTAEDFTNGDVAKLLAEGTTIDGKEYSGEQFAGVVDLPGTEDIEDITTPVSEVAINSNAKIWSFEKNIYVENAGREIQIVNASGSIVKTIKANNSRMEIPMQQAGIYIVKTAAKTQKVMIK